MWKLSICILFLVIANVDFAEAQRGSFEGSATGGSHSASVTLTGEEIYNNNNGGIMGVKGEIEIRRNGAKKILTTAKFNSRITTANLIQDGDHKAYEITTKADYEDIVGRSRSFILRIKLIPGTFKQASGTGLYGRYDVFVESGTFGKIPVELFPESGRTVKITGNWKDGGPFFMVAEGKKGLVVGRYGKRADLDQFIGKREGNIVSLTFNVPGHPAHSTCDFTICPGGHTMTGPLVDLATGEVYGELIWTKKPVGTPRNLIGQEYTDCKQLEFNVWGYPF